MIATRHGYTECGSMCCGLGEYQGLNDAGFTAEGAVRAIAEDGRFDQSLDDREGYSFCQLVLTQMIPRHTLVRIGARNLNSLVRYINRHKLGTIVVTPPEVNPNSGNKVKGALFAPNPAAMRRWMEEHNIETDRYDRFDRGGWL